MDVIFPHGQDIHFIRTIRSQEFTLSIAEGLYPLSYGCVVGKLYLFKGKVKNCNWCSYFWVNSIASWCNFGAIRERYDLAAGGISMGV